ncbi:MAG: protein kinase domain-containing protein [Planctomycetota bacterium]
MHSSGDRDPVELLADEFVARCRNGDSPSVSEYLASYPQYASQIEQLFPAAAWMEQLRAAEHAERDTAVRRAWPSSAPKRIGDFEIVQEIGRGGMGVVYEAMQRSLARRVALKVLPKHALLADRHRRGFQREAQTAARLNHTNVVPVFGVGEEDGLHYYVMPLVRGVGLDAIIRELRAANDAVDAAATPKGTALPPQESIAGLVHALLAKRSAVAQCRPSPTVPASSSGAGVASRWREVARLGAQAADALAYAHAQGTIHRDVKPANLLVDDEGNACLSDFGLAGAIDGVNSSENGEAVGTPRYMAPEQREGRADARSDVFGLGLTLYELLTLRPAHAACSAGEPSHARHSSQRLIPPREVNRAIPRDLEAIVLKCLASEPSHRYQTAADLAADLRRFLEDRPVRARHASGLEQAWRACRRNPALAAMSGMAALLVVAFVSAALGGYLRTRAAWHETRQALVQANATSTVALDVLEGIYLQLSPERIWIPTDSDSAGQACACVGLRSAGPVTPYQANYIQVQASEQTAALLGNLLVFYDRLAEQAGDNLQVRIESAIATRRVGDIRQRLGQIALAEKEYLSAVEKLKALLTRANSEVRLYVEMARNYNEIGNLRAARSGPESAFQSHRNALEALRSMPAADPSPEEYRYELARTYFLLGSRRTGAFADSRDEHDQATSDQPGLRSPSNATPTGQHYLKRLLSDQDLSDQQYRGLAIEILEELARAHPSAADYRFLLALCHRPPNVVLEPGRGLAASRGRARALKLLESLTAEFPQVADYRYELAATYAWVHVGLFPWQARSVATPDTERSLRRALDETRLLVDHNPSIPHYARSKALLSAKLGTLCWETDRLVEAATCFDEAIHTQATLVERFPDVPDQDRVLLEFFRLREAEVLLRADGASDVEKRLHARELLATCVQNMTHLAQPADLADDRVASHVIARAREALASLRHN